MSSSEDELRQLLNEGTPNIDENVALTKVLKQSSQTTAMKDVGSIFVGWLWVIFLGFGASAYSAKRRIELHKQNIRRINHDANKQYNKNNTIGEQK